MEIVSFQELISRTESSWPLQMDMKVYDGLPFECACGASHIFSHEATEVMCEMGGMRVVLTCPSTNHVTCIRIRGVIRRRFEALYGADLPTIADWPMIGDQGPGPHTGFEPFLADDVRNPESGLPFRVATTSVAGPDGENYWVTVVLGYGQDTETGAVIIEGKNSFTRTDEESAKEVHAQVVEALGHPIEEWSEHLPNPWPRGGPNEAVTAVLEALGPKLRSRP